MVWYVHKVMNSMLFYQPELSNLNKLFLAGGGAMFGACFAAGVDLEFSWVFTDDNIYNAGGHSLRGELEGKLAYGSKIVPISHQRKST